MSAEEKKFSNYPDDLRTFRQNHNETELLVEAMKKLAEEMEPLREAKTCLSVGTGFGQYDIMFIERFLPNLEKLIVLERDRNCTDELKVNLSNVFGGKLEVEFHTTSIESFVEKHSSPDIDGGSLYKKVDVVLAFHSLYALEPADLLKFFEACARIWLSSSFSSRLVVVHSADNPSYVELCKKIKTKICNTIEGISKCLESLGYSPLHEILYCVNIDVKDPSRVFKIFFKLEREVPYDAMMKGLKELAVDDIMAQNTKLVVFGVKGR